MELELYEEVVGDCVVCGADATGSRYWLGMTAAQWDIIRPFVEEMTPVSPHSGVKLVMNMLFVPQLCKALCGPKCAQAHYRQVAADNLKKGN